MTLNLLLVAALAAVSLPLSPATSHGKVLASDREEGGDLNPQPLPPDVAVPSILV